jgi:hypothetical protein
MNLTLRADQSSSLLLFVSATFLELLDHGKHRTNVVFWWMGQQRHSWLIRTLQCPNCAFTKLWPARPSRESIPIGSFSQPAVIPSDFSLLLSQLSATDEVSCMP